MVLLLVSIVKAPLLSVSSSSTKRFSLQFTDFSDYHGNLAPSVNSNKKNKFNEIERLWEIPATFDHQRGVAYATRCKENRVKLSMKTIS